MSDLLTEYQRLTGHMPKKVASGSDGEEWAGPCPTCKGEDRFIMWPQKGKWLCRGCERDGREYHGDTIAFLKLHAGLSFSAAKAQLGLDSNLARPKPVMATDQERKSQKASEKAIALYETAKPLGSEGHSYLAGKGVKPCLGLKVDQGGNLLVPVKEAGGRIVSVQTITRTGEKQFLHGCSLGDGLFEIEGDAGPVVVCEGLATGLSIHQATGYRVVLAFMAGRLAKIAKQAQALYPDRPIIVAADFDPKENGANPGLQAAEKAAFVVGGSVAVPDLGGKACDFNDLFQERGSDEVKAQIKATHPPVAAGDGPEIQNHNVKITALPPVPQGIFGAVLDPILKQAEKAFVIPPEIPVAALLAMTSACVGRRCCISPKTGWCEHGNLFICLIASSGSGKSHCAKAFFQAIRNLEGKWYDEWQEKEDKYERQQAIYNLAQRKKKATPDDLVTPKKPRRKQLVVNDTTPEALMDALSQNPTGILWLRDEIMSLFQEADRYSNGERGAVKTMLLSAYDGDELKINRAKARNLYIKSTCLAVFGGLQSELLSECFSKTDRFSGLVPRFLFINAVRRKARMWAPEKFGDAYQEVLAHKVKRLLSLELRNGQPRTLTLGLEAEKAFIEWYNTLAVESWLSDENAKARAAKLQAQCLRLILLLHLLDWACMDTDQEPEREIPKETVIRGLRLVDWFKQHLEFTDQLLMKGNSEAAKAAADPVNILAARAILELGPDRMVKGASASDITKLVNSEIPNEYKFSVKSVGHTCSRLGLSSHKSNGLRIWRATAETMSQIAELAGEDQQTNPATADNIKPDFDFNCAGPQTVAC